MTKRHAIELLMFAWKCGYGGEVVVPKMHAVKIIDLANTMLKIACKGSSDDSAMQEIQYVGSRVGEKLYEELISLEEGTDDA